MAEDSYSILIVTDVNVALVLLCVTRHLKSVCMHGSKCIAALLHISYFSLLYFKVHCICYSCLGVIW
jgi:hypothetical protein